MAGDWIKLRKCLFSHPKVARMASACAMSEHQVVGWLAAIWCWADEHAVDGVVDAVRLTDVHRVTLAPEKFLSSMRQVGWIIESADGVSFPDFDRHMSQSAKKRGEKAVRQAKWREKSCRRGVDTTASTREEKRREEKKKRSRVVGSSSVANRSKAKGKTKENTPPHTKDNSENSSLQDGACPHLGQPGHNHPDNPCTICAGTGFIVSKTVESAADSSLPNRAQSAQAREAHGPIPDDWLPPELNTPEFQATWGIWLCHLMENGQCLQYQAQSNQLAALAKYGPEKACEIIDRTIRDGGGQRNVRLYFDDFTRQEKGGVF